MSRWYDQPCAKCEGCHWRQPGMFPDGTPYEACRAAGYILHYDKGVSEDDCRLFESLEDYARRTAREKVTSEKPKRK